ncbi:MAG TPA: nucleotidyl transferase AbiEii/AbiGii toxin family protein [Longimicrobium sp.]|nr:nucleotidyl transferase AbiEii/AbiGii toxin family protein [Longimicrobium sp.]
MLPLRDIIAWRAHAAWRTDAQVEQDLLITRAMLAIFGDPFLGSQVAMRGGTILHKVHLAPAARYSEDIDLVVVGDRPPTHIRRALLRVLRPLLGEPPVNVVESVRLAVRNIARPSQIIRLGYGFRPTSPPPPAAKLKIEVNVTEREPVFDLVKIPYAPPLEDRADPVLLVSYDVDEMLGTKMRALRQREHGRDLFDLAHAWHHCTGTASAGRSAGDEVPRVMITPSRVAHAFTEYMRREGTIATCDDYSDDLARKLTLARFRADLTDVLATDVAYDVDAAAAVLRDVFLPHLPGGPRAVGGTAGTRAVVGASVGSR